MMGHVEPDWDGTAWHEVLATLDEGVTVHDATGQLLFANQAAAELIGAESPAELTTAPSGALVSMFDNFTEDGRLISPDEMPGRRVLLGEDAEPLVLRNVHRASGRERWIVIKSRA